MMEQFKEQHFPEEPPLFATGLIVGNTTTMDDAAAAWESMGGPGRDRDACVRLHRALPCLPGPDPLKSAIRLARTSAGHIKKILVCGRQSEDVILSQEDSGVRFIEGCLHHEYQDKHQNRPLEEHPETTLSYLYTGKLYLEAGTSGIAIQNFEGEVVIGGGGVIGINIEGVSGAKVRVTVTPVAMAEGDVDMVISGQKMHVEISTARPHTERPIMKTAGPSRLHIVNIKEGHNNTEEHRNQVSVVSEEMAPSRLEPGRMCLGEGGGPLGEGGGPFCIWHHARSLRCALFDEPD